ncbi:MAG: AI-2E family transporter [Oscillospiraceae bacterium]|nr:AI-2E family transporter [Oscillospiraceae bacterium]
MKNKTYWHWGLTLALTACAILVFYDTFFQDGVLLLFIKKLFKILTPVIYGFALAYLLAPIVNFFDRSLKSASPRMRSGAVRALSILIAWALAALVIYILMSILIPQLYASILLLASNMETYYRTVYAWVTRMLENNPDVANWATGMIREYYKELVSWVTETWIPQAQQTIALVTGGVVSVVIFLKDLLVGVIVSIYLLATKERFGAHSRALLYSVVSEPRYQATLHAVKKMDTIFSGFVRGKLLDSLIIGILCFIVCSILKMPYAPLVSVIVGVTNIIPFFGPFLGAIPSAFLILLVSPLKCLYFIIFILVLQQFDGNILGPKILGNSTNLSSFWVIVAILVGGGFFGVAGMFLGVPLFACVYACVKFWSEKRLHQKGVSYDSFLSASNPRSEISSPDTTESNPQGGNQ